MLLDQYIYLFHKRLDILINLKKCKFEKMSLMVKDKQLLENYNKIWRKKIEALMGIDKLLMVMMINI